MSIYKVFPGIKGSKRYMRDGRTLKTADVPSNIVDLLKNQNEVDDTQLKSVEKPYKKCVFCGMETKLYRIANGQSLYICEEHYHNMTLGQVVQQAELVTVPEKPDYDALDKILNGAKDEETIEQD